MAKKLFGVVVKGCPDGFLIDGQVVRTGETVEAQERSFLVNDREMIVSSEGQEISRHQLTEDPSRGSWRITDKGISSNVFPEFESNPVQRALRMVGLHPSQVKL